MNKKNKKAQAGTFLPYILVGIVIILIFAIIVIPISYTGDKIFDELKESPNFQNSNKSVERINQVQNLMTPAFDQLVFIILIAIILGCIAIAIFTDYHPVVVGIFIIAIVLLVIISGLFANVYDDFKTTEKLENKSEEFVYTNAIMGKQLPIIIGLVGVISIIILLAKRGRVISPA